MDVPQDDLPTFQGQSPDPLTDIAGDVRDPSHKLDLRYFTDARFCPAMVRRRSRRAFELFLFLARRSLDAYGEPISPTHEELCRACRLDPDESHARVTLSRLLRDLRSTFGVIDYEPARRRRPQIRLVPPAPDGYSLHPEQYIYLEGVWNDSTLPYFDRLGSAAFAAEYMSIISAYEAAMARAKQGRAYWFYPLERIAATFHISTGFAGTGLRGLVELGVLRVAYGQFGMTPNADEFGRANRYYYEGLSEIDRRDEGLRRLAAEFEAEFPRALEWSAVLTNGATLKNVGGLCELIRQQGPTAVVTGIERLQRLPRRSLKRRLPYLAADLERR